MGSKLTEIPYDSLFELSLNAISVHTLVLDEIGRPMDYRFDAVNPAFEKLTGLSSTVILGKTVKEVLPGVEALWIDRYGQVGLTGIPISFESYSQDLGLWVQVSAFRHKPLGFTVSFIDITGRILAMEKAQQEQTKYKALFELGNAVKLVIEIGSGAILGANPRAVEFYGWTLDELKRMTIDQINILGPEEIRAEMERAKSQKDSHFAFRHRLKSGEVREVESFVSPVQWDGRDALFSIVHDVTQVNLIQKRALQRERLSAVGELTACLYHEFGNLLGVLFGQIQLMELQIPPGEAKDKLHARVGKLIFRAQKLIESVKRFSRDEGIQLHSCRLGLLLEDLVELEHPLCRNLGIEITFVPTEGDEVNVDTALIQQVFLNLFKNAIQALVDVESPRIFLEVTSEETEVVVRLGNNGTTIPPEVRAKLFTPFFTTKKGNQVGTGLGLSFSSNIVTNHGGTMFLEEGTETVFQVRLPRSQPAP